MWLLALLACGTTPHHHDHDHDHDHAHEAPPPHHRFDDAERWAKVFDDPERDGWQQPAKVITALDLSPGMTVADIGAGTGYFNPHLAKAVGPDGVVLAIDIEPTLVEHMKARATTENTPQVVPRLTTATSPGLKPAEADRVLLVDTYHHIGDRAVYFRQLRDGMKPTGKLVIVDLTKAAPFGPPASERLTAEEVTAELTKAGWLPSGSASLKHQYVAVYTVAPQ